MLAAGPRVKSVRVAAPRIAPGRTVGQGAPPALGPRAMAGGKRLDHIDGMRGIAALLVVLQHSMQMVREGGSPMFDVLLMNINLGRLGVALFFLISGLVVPYSIRGDQPLRNFAISRFFRLYPAYWLSLAAFVVMGYFWLTPFGVPRVLANITMLQGLISQAWDVGPGYWTLFYELMFYFLCALLCVLKLLRNVTVNAAIVLVTVSLPLIPMALGPDAAGEVDGWEMPFLFGLFFLGMLLRRAFVEGDAAAMRWSAFLVLFTTPIAVLLGGALYAVPDNANQYLSPMALGTSMALPVPLFVLVLWLRPTPSRLLIYLGTISYSFYLFQDIGLLLLPKVLDPGEWGVIYVLAVLGLTVTIAALVYRFVEKPMQALGKRLTHRLSGPAETAALPAAAA
jgi:peptidoglycan/LPS O-acetylase OafA/YrhL